MYLSNIKLWNYRKFGSDGEFSLDKPNLDLNFTKGLNVLIGENDSGKTAIVDAIKMVLKTHSYEWYQIQNDDFFNNAEKFRIELKFEDLNEDEGKNFTEWLGWSGEGENAMSYLRLVFDVIRGKDKGRIISSDVRAGTDDTGYLLNAEARDYLKVTYLKPLRDAETELTSRKNSRLSKILYEHEAFKDVKDHLLEVEFLEVNQQIEKYFIGEKNDGTLLIDQKGKDLKQEIDKYLKSFYDATKEGQFGVSKVDDLKSILEKLDLSIKNLQSPGLGTLNRLCMSTELLHLNKKNWSGIRLGLIEELEAHLHPQAQMQVIESLQEEKDIQLIITTHSPNIGSKLKLENLIICSSSNAYPMGSDYTKLSPADYKFLEIFLDATKSNLFFANGIILVEGWTEELIIPSIAKKLNLDLTKKGISIVNIGSTAFLRYSKIFLRAHGNELEIPVSIITDLDVKPEDEDEKKDQAIQDLKQKYDEQKVKVFVSPKWTIEYCLFHSASLKDKFIEIVKEVHSGTDWTDFEEVLKDKLNNKKLNKTEIAYRLAIAIEEDLLRETPEISISDDDEFIKYIIDGIKYASGS